MARSQLESWLAAKIGGLDLSLMQNQPIKERYKVRFRAEFFNAFNTPFLTLGSESSVTVNTPQFAKALTGTNLREIQLGLRLVF